MNKWPSLLVLFSLLLSACSLNAPPASPPAPAGKLAEIIARGRLVIATDLAYPPQSELAPGATRAANTRCLSTEYTAGELTGFDVDVAVEIARQIGVEPCFVAPPWTQITGGGWGDRWDISVGSMAITPERVQVLYFAQPYYTTPAAFFVRQDDTTFKQPGDLSGKKIGTCVGCTYEYYLQGSLAIPGQKIDFVVKDAVIAGYDIENTALEALAAGQLDAVLTGVPLGQTLRAGGLPIKQLGEPVFTEYLAVAVDKKAKDAAPLVSRITQIVQQMHSNGALLKLAQKYYGQDLTTAAAKFNLKSLDQLP